jgi:pyrroloquinoline quinone (PQQ) biosynthesis protein C
MNVKLKENLWRIAAEGPSATLIVGGQAFAVPTEPALVFMKIRPYCTGHHSIKSIADKSGVAEESIRALLNSLSPSGILSGPGAGLPVATATDVRERIKRIVKTWGLELAASYIGNELGRGHLSRTVLVGWLLEMYHYIKDFPNAIDAALRCAPPALQPVYRRYRNEESGHEVFVLRSLMRLGLSEDEVRNSVPLVSTRSIGLLMKELFEKEPVALLIVAALVEAQEFDSQAIAGFKDELVAHYGVTKDALDPYFEHQKIDVNLGHAQLLDEHVAWLDELGGDRLDQVIDGVHDIKHAFDLQGIEVKHYYGCLNGRYFPRQPMSFEAIS